MKVLIDLTYIKPDSVSGVKNYALRLIDGFQKYVLQIKIILLVTEQNEFYLKKLFPQLTLLKINDRNRLFFGRLRILKRLKLNHAANRLIKKNKIDCLLSPYLHQDSISASQVPHIAVLHDAQSFVLDREKGFKGFIKRMMFLWVLHLVRHLVTISESSKRSIIKEIPFLKTPITIIYNSIPLSKSYLSDSALIATPYVLYVNTLMPYKNVETVVRAFASIKDLIDHNLIIKAKRTPYWDSVVLPLIYNLGVVERVILIETNFTESEMASLYKNATVFVSPSTMEGFGYTPIEAAIHKVPVICAAENTLLETTRGLLNYYEPANNFQGLADKIKNIIFNPPQSEELQSISVCLANAYAQEKQVKQFESLLLHIVGER